MTTFEPSPAMNPMTDRMSAAPPMAARQDSIATMDMHIPGAWVGTNPSTPAPISEDMKYFGQALKTLPDKVQGYLRESSSFAWLFSIAKTPIHDVFSCKGPGCSSWTYVNGSCCRHDSR
jgi:hypothetical protein